MESHRLSSQTTKQVSAYLETILVLIWGLFFLSFPFVFSTATTEAFLLPKQLLLTIVVLLSLLIWGAKMLIEGKTKLRRTPLDLPVLILAIFLLASSLFAVNRADSLIAVVPVLLTILSFFIITNIVKSESSILFLVSTIVVSAAFIGLLTTLSYFKIYLFPFTATHVSYFTPLGSLLEQAYYLVFIVPIALYFASPILKGNVTGKTFIFSFAAGAIVLGIIFSIAQLLTTQKPFILPFETGFQTAFAAFSQDTRRIAQGFFFGSGYGTFLNDFTRFKQAPYNLNPNLWYISFTQSSSFILELLATTGLLGLLSFLFISLKIIKKHPSHFSNPLTTSLVLIIIVAFLLPFSYLSLALFLFLLALYATAQSFLEPKKYFEVELHLVTLKKGLIALHPEGRSETAERGFTKIVPVSFCIIFLLFAGVVGFFATRFLLSDIAFQKSLIAASNNNGSQTYQLEIQAITLFPYRDSYYRVFSQTNLALANALATTRAKDLQNDPQQQRILYSLIQQSINSARTATALSPQTALNWQNLGAVYRSLIGFGQNAENFSILATQQAVALDPANPQEYITLGGIYYQLGQYDNAIREFQTAANLKPDFANAYYNIGHALEQKGDLKGALDQYERVQTLVAKDQNNLKKINDEIAALKTKIPSSQTAPPEQISPTPTPTPQVTLKPTQKSTQLPLNLNAPTTVLPTQKPPVQIPPPQTSSESGR